MANIRVDVGFTIKDGVEIVFRSPVDCSAVTGLKVYYPGADGNETAKEFAFADAHGNNVGDIPHLFAENVVVKVILDVTSGMAFVQNADTNAYIEKTFIKTINGKTPDENGNVEIEAGGLSATAASLLVTILRNGVYSSDQSANITALENALGSSGGDEPVIPDNPDEPEVALSSISATYSGGDVAVGTAVTDLTGIVVTAHYSDGSTATVTDYTLSGEIAEGENTVTVSYGGKTATFSVTGVAESGTVSTEGVSSINWLLKNRRYGTDNVNNTWCKADTADTESLAAEPDNGYLVCTTAADGLATVTANSVCVCWPLISGKTYNIVLSNAATEASYFNLFAGKLNAMPVKGEISNVEGERVKAIEGFNAVPASGTKSYSYTPGDNEWLFIKPNIANVLTITAEVTA